MTQQIAVSRSEVEALCREYHNRVRIHAHRLRNIVGPRADVDNLLSDGNLGLVRAAYAWLDIPQERRMADFGTWAAVFIRRSMVDGLRREWGRSFQRQENYSLDENVGHDEGEDLTFMDVLADRRVDIEAQIEYREALVEYALMPEPTEDEKKRGKALSENELEVLIGAAMGETARATAERLVKSIETIKEQRKSVLRKLGAVDMTNAVWVALRDGALSGLERAA